MMKSRVLPLEQENQVLQCTVEPISVLSMYSVVSPLYTAPMEMIAKNGEKRKFKNLGKREMKANLGVFGVKKQAILRANSTYFALQCNLCSTSM